MLPFRRRVCARERACLPFGRRVYGCASPFGRRLRIAEWVRVNGRAYHLAGMCVTLSGCIRKRVCLPYGRHACSAEQVQVSGCAYHLAGVCAALSGCA